MFQISLRVYFTRLPTLFFVEFLTYSPHSLFRLPGKPFPRWFWLKCPSSWCHTINGRAGPPWNCQKSRRCRFRLALATCSTGVKESCLQPHSPLCTVGAQCLEIAPVHTTSYTSLRWVFDLSYFCQKKFKYSKTSKVLEDFVTERSTLLVFYLATVTQLWHITPHIVAWHSPSAAAYQGGPLNWAALVLSLVREMLQPCLL